MLLLEADLLDSFLLPKVLSVMTMFKYLGRLRIRRRIRMKKKRLRPRPTFRFRMLRMALIELLVATA